jgi:hypothetical protein
MELAEQIRETTCPSAPPDTGAVLLGVIAGKGEVVYITPSMPVTSSLLESFSQNGIPVENRLRFASPCIRHQCVQWSGDRCGLIDRAVLTAEKDEDRSALPKCGIRSTCRWFAQHGKNACAVCPEVVRKPAGA